MKNLISTSVMVLFLAFGAVAQNNAPAATPAAADPNAPKMKFDTEVIDYGTIEHNADGYRFFKFKNTGKKDVVITNCQGSCGCTVPTFSKEPVKPGETGEIKVHYATDRIGAFTKTVTVTSNADGSPIVLTIKGTVLPDPTPAPGTAPAPATTPK